MGLLFTSDTHFWHQSSTNPGKSILSYCPARKTIWPTIEEMNEGIISNWNEAVKPEDTVFHLGDFCLVRKDLIPTILPRLNGNIVLVRGNHDQGAANLYKSGFKTVLEATKIKINGKNIYMRHHPPTKPNWPSTYNVQLFLCGHVHQAWSKRTTEFNMDGKEQTGYIINVGVDANGYRPKTLDELLAQPPIPEKPREDQCVVCGTTLFEKPDGTREPCPYHPPLKEGGVYEYKITMEKD